MANQPIPIWRPKTFTTAEAMLDEVRSIIAADHRMVTAIATQVGVAPTTIHNIASGKTKWPRQSTLFPLLDTLGYRMSITRK